MRRTEQLQGLRLMKFEDVYGRCYRGDLSQAEASETVGRTKKSIDARAFAWFHRNVRHVCDGGFGSRARYLDTVASETSMPSFRSSPWIRGAPHSGFSRLMRLMRARTSRGIGGRPPLRRRDFHVQYSRKPFRCQPMTVSGFTITSISRQFGNSRDRTTQSRRSVGRSEVRREVLFIVAS